MTKVLALLVIVSTTVIVGQVPSAQAGVEAGVLRPCRTEDGSGQRVCVWDARHAGNGVGDSFIAFRGGTDRARYVYVRHAVAHALLHQR